MITRKGFIKIAVAGGASAYLATKGGYFRSAEAAQSPQIPLNPKNIPQFTEPVPDLLSTESLILNPTAPLHLIMTEHKTNVLPAGAVPGYTGTYVWSYLQEGQFTRTSFLGPVIVTKPGVPVEIRFTNNLGFASTTNVLAYRYSTDQTLHWADPIHGGMNMWNHMASPPPVGSEGAENYLGPIPACPHLHGGYVPPVIDGGPDSWFTSDGVYHGTSYYTYPLRNVAGNECVYRYPSNQEPGLIWFHDHTLGATRLNVYSGLAGAYLIADLSDPSISQLPALTPLVIQDRMFDTNGQLFFPADSAGGILWALNPEHPYWVPEFVGDTICVNGKAWPFMPVNEQRYTLLLINGSNARTYSLQLQDLVSGNFGPPLWVIGTDGGLLDTPVKIDPAATANNKLFMMPGERYWVIVDFAGFSQGVVGPNGQPYSGKWIIKNQAPAPYPSGTSPQGATTGRIMQFVVNKGFVADPSYNPASGLPLRQPMIRLTGAPVTKTRQLTLNEIHLMPRMAIDPVTGLATAYPGGPEEILVNNTKWDGQRIVGVDENNMYMMQPIDSTWPTDPAGDYLSEVPKEGETEIWEIVNTTMDAHPIHTHLAQFQLLNRQNYNTNKYLKAYAAAFPGGYDYTLKATVGPGLYIPAYGPPLNYQSGNTRALGGNPDITPYLQGPVQPALPQENGWKDTVMAPPGMVTRFIVRWAQQNLPANTAPAAAALPFDPAALGGAYVWHCHIVDHEDNEMMRPDMIDPQAGATRTYVQGVDY